MVEQLICNQPVEGSIPFASSQSILPRRKHETHPRMAVKSCNLDLQERIRPCHRGDSVLTEPFRSGPVVHVISNIQFSFPFLLSVVYEAIFN